MSRVLKKQIEPLARQEIPRHLLKPKVHYVFTRALHQSLSWARWIPATTSKSISVRSILILSSHLKLGIQSCIFPKGFPINFLFISHLPHARYMPRPSHPSWFDCPNIIWLSTNYESPRYAVFSSFLFGPNIPLSTLFSNTLNLYCSFNVRDQVSHPYKTAGKIIVLCILAVKPQGLNKKSQLGLGLGASPGGVPKRCSSGSGLAPWVAKPLGGSPGPPKA
jgi:hypothetical protein